MMNRTLDILRVTYDRMWRYSALAATGGEWSLTLPVRVRQNLRWFWLNGFFASASDHIFNTYLVLYILGLGASQAQIGFLSSLSSLTGALLLLPGAMLVERLGHRKHIALASGFLSRSMMLLLALLPLIYGGPALAMAAIGLAVIKDAFGNLSFPAWMSITAELVPVEGRGRYFASRNFAMGLSGMAITLLAGQLITLAGTPTGYQAALAAAFVLGLFSTSCFSRLHDAPARLASAPTTSLSPRSVWNDLAARPGFVWLAATAALWNFSLNIAGPFFTVYLVQELNATAAMVAVTATATTLSTLATQRKLGELSDRWGARRVQLLSGILIPILPLSWIFVTAPWQVIPVNLLGGVIWGAYNLASFTFLLTLIPAEQRARFSALYQVVVMVSLAAGAAFGGLVITLWGMKTVFLLSALGRIVAVFLFSRFVSDPQAPAPQAAAELGD